MYEFIRDDLSNKYFLLENFSKKINEKDNDMS